MTAKQAIYNFMSSFDIPAYEEKLIYAGELSPELPYITYSHISANRAGEKSECHIDIWCDNGSGYSLISSIENAIAVEVGLEGMQLDFDGGTILIRRGKPFAADLAQKDPYLKCRRVNLTVEFTDSDDGIIISNGDESMSVSVFGCESLILQPSFVGGTATTVTGVTVMDILGIKRKLEAKTGWISEEKSGSLMEIISRSPLVLISCCGESGYFILEMPKIRERIFDSASGLWFVKLSISGTEVGLSG